jgi:hypothetical protein
MGQPDSHWLTDHVITLSREVSALSERQEATEEDLSAAIFALRRLERQLERVRAARNGIVKEYRIEIMVALGLLAVWSGVLTIDELKSIALGSALP